MKPYYTDDWLTLYGGDCREVLSTLPSDSVDCVVTSPPYWGLRDYGTEGQLGLERTPEEYVANMVAVFREVRRVLKPSGTCWLNLGDSYAGSWGAQSRGGAPSESSTLRGNGHVGGGPKAKSISAVQIAAAPKGTNTGSWVNGRTDLKPKDLVGIPWRVAFALQADGWYLRSDIIWSKPNPMPESVTDRPTKSHEYLFLLTKSARYYFDSDAVREADAGYASGNGFAGRQGGARQTAVDGGNGSAERFTPGAGRNIRSVWNIATRPYPGAHFAVFPPELPERCIKAGSSEKGVCPECGAPWERVVDVQRGGSTSNEVRRAVPTSTGHNSMGKVIGSDTRGLPSRTSTTTGWRPNCAHKQLDLERLEPTPEAAVILDPFGGSGTVGMVANRLSRRAILIDLNPEYLEQQMKRNAQTPLGLTEGDAA